MRIRHHKTFSWRAFLRSTDPELLARFFATYEPFGEIDFATDLAEWGEAIPMILGAMGEDGLRAQDAIESVNDLTADKAWQHVLRAVAEAGMDMGDKPKAHDVAMTLYLDHSSRFWECLSAVRVEAIERWSEFIGKEAKAPDLSAGARETLEHSLGEYFANEGLGSHCEVDQYRVGARVHLEIAFVDRVQANEEFDGESIHTSFRRPALYAIGIYVPASGRLKLKVHRNRQDWITRARQEIGASLFGDRSFFPSEEEQTGFELNVLRERPTFPGYEEFEIKWVQLVGLTFKSLWEDLTTELRAGNTDQVYSALDQYGVDIGEMEVIGANIRFKFPGRGRSGQRTVYLTMPSGHNLNVSPSDTIIEKLLQRWGIARGEGLVENAAESSG